MFVWSSMECGRHFRSVSESLISANTKEDALTPGTWSELDKSSQAILPVLIRHADQKGKAYPSEYRLAAMSGLLDRKTVRRATKKMADWNLITMKKIITRAGHRQKIYGLETVICNGSGINIPSIHIDGGNWACLLPSAKSLAMCFWYFSKPRPDLDPDHGGERWLVDDDMYDYLLERKVDYCDAEPSVLREFANVSRRAYRQAIDSLIDRYIIAPHPERPEGWMVYVMPPSIIKRSYLNDHFGRDIW